MYSYEDFSIEITEVAEGHTVRARALGEIARAQTAFALEPLVLQNRVQAVAIASLGAGRGDRRVASTAE